jgi:fibronectin type 3 domain-containing protein
VSGTVNPNGTATQAFFEYGTSSTLATSTATANQSIGAGTAAVSVTQAISPLLPNTTYYYRVVATNSAGTTRGSILSFTTQALAPSPPSNVVAQATTSGQRSVSLQWQAPAGVSPTSYSIERRQGSGTTFAEIGTSATTTFTDNINLANNTSYTYQVRSCVGTADARVCSAPSLPSNTVSFGNP